MYSQTNLFSTRGILHYMGEVLVMSEQIYYPAGSAPRRHFTTTFEQARTHPGLYFIDPYLRSPSVLDFTRGGGIYAQLGCGSASTVGGFHPLPLVSSVIQIKVLYQEAIMLGS
ncbi:hypothetical protein B0H16DRAFT_1473520 [Mycena metata]|uniref:Uncharacterized protein n=1 Tax=Mycena metata TaxID=1033252 RepID=A0AAD7MLV5_9AGAR|nr:hypothetical protein B0H16DRAFT_1473520 [Mycena metata]